MLCGPKAALIRFVAVASVLGMLSGCVTTRDFRNPRHRITPGTAYTLAPDDTEIGASLLGLGVTDAGAALGVRHGFGRRWQLGANLAHAMLGVITVTGKTNIVDRRHFGFGLEGAFLYTRPSIIWLLPADVKEPIEKVNLFAVPLNARFSFPATRWFSGHISLGYTHVSIVGPVEVDDTLVEGGLGMRRLHVDPTLHFFAGGKVAFIVGGSLPLRATLREDVVARSEIEPGVVVGVASSEWVRIPFRDAARFHAGIEVRFGQAHFTYIRLLAVRGILSGAGIAPPVVPTIRAYWRF